MKFSIKTLILIIACSSLAVRTMAATDTFNVTASSFSDYTINSELDPALSLVRGQTYYFDINVTAIHPFYIKTAPATGTGSQYTDGLSGDPNGTTSGIIIFTVPNDAPDTLYYQCSNHSAMNGPLNIIDPPLVVITELSVSNEIVIASTGYDSDILNLSVLVSTNLSTNTVWTPASIQSNVHDNGTNTTTVTLPAGDNAVFQIQQGFFD